MINKKIIALGLTDNDWNNLRKFVTPGKDNIKQAAQAILVVPIIEEILKSYDDYVESLTLAENAKELIDILISGKYSSEYIDTKVRLWTKTVVEEAKAEAKAEAKKLTINQKLKRYWH